MSEKFDLDSLVRANIRNLTPYRSARDDFDSGLLLDANENSRGAPFPEAEGLHRYPSSHQEKLKAKIAEWRKLDAANVFTGVGSDEAIDLLFRIFCEPGEDRVMVTPPTYGMYEVAANIHNIAIDRVLLDEHFQPRVEPILETARENTKLLFLCSPNNPTGNTFSIEKVEKILTSFPGIVVIDEAYIDFSDTTSWTSRIADFPNMVVLQTMSKSFGLAGIRLGIAFSSGEIAGYLDRVKAPYNINTLTGRYAAEAFEHLDRINKNIAAIVGERKRLIKELSRLSTVRNIYPSSANFLLVNTKNARQVYNRLAEKDVIVRFRGNEPLCKDCLRITVGTKEDNDRLIQILDQLDS